MLRHLSPSPPAQTDLRSQRAASPPWRAPSQSPSQCSPCSPCAQIHNQLNCCITISLTNILAPGEADTYTLYVISLHYKNSGLTVDQARI